MPAKKKGTSGKPGEVLLFRDPDSYQKPLAAALKQCTETLNGKVPRVADAGGRLRTAMDDFNALQAYQNAVADCMEQASFQDLPGVRSWGRRMTGFHQLCRDPFRGIFLLGEDRYTVIALYFSRKPHHPAGRLKELAAPYRASLATETEDDT